MSDEPIAAEALNRAGWRFEPVDEIWTWQLGNGGAIEVQRLYGFVGKGRGKADRIYRFEVAIRWDNDTDPNDMYSDPESVINAVNAKTMGDLDDLKRLFGKAVS